MPVVELAFPSSVVPNARNADGSHLDIELHVQLSESLHVLHHVLIALSLLGQLGLHIEQRAGAR